MRVRALYDPHVAVYWSLPMLSGHEKISEGVFAKIFKKNSVGTETTTDNHPIDSKYSKCHQTAHQGVQLLPAGLSASDFTAKPLSFDMCNGQTVYTYTLYKKQENEKAVAKHWSGFEPAIREKARAPIRIVHIRIKRRG